MTIQLLHAFNGYSPGIYSNMGAPEEARLISLGLARAFVAGMDGKSSTGSLTRDATDAAQAAFDATGALGSSPVSVTGTPGVNNVLSATLAAGWSVTGYQWTRSGTNISGATGSTYMQVAADRGNTISVKVTGLAYSGGAVIPPAAAPYEGNFATAVQVPDSFSASSNQFISRTRHIARATLVNAPIKARFPNFYCPNTSNGAEVGPGGVATVSASLIVGGVGSAGAIVGGGAVTPLTWGGSSSVTANDNGMTPFHDPVSISVNPGDAIWYQVAYQNAVAIIYQGGGTGSEAQDSTNGETIRFAASGLDLSQINSKAAWIGGSTSPNLIYRPVNIVATITEPSVGIVGTSIEMGFKSSAKGAAAGNKGIAMRAVAGSYGVVNCAHGSSTAAQFLVPANVVNRMDILRYTSHIELAHGVNDITGATAAQTAGYLASIIAMFTGKPVNLHTVPPRTTGAWTLADGSDQVAHSSGAVRTTLNGLIRAGIAGAAGYRDSAAAASLSGTSADDTKWYADGSANYMFQTASPADGLHPGTQGDTYIVASGFLNPATISR